MCGGFCTSTKYRRTVCIVHTARIFQRHQQVSYFRQLLQAIGWDIPVVIAGDVKDESSSRGVSAKEGHKLAQHFWLPFY